MVLLQIESAASRQCCLEPFQLVQFYSEPAAANIQAVLKQPRITLSLTYAVIQVLYGKNQLAMTMPRVQPQLCLMAVKV